MIRWFCNDVIVFFRQQKQVAEVDDKVAEVGEPVGIYSGSGAQNARSRDGAFADTYVYFAYTYNPDPIARL